MQTTIEVRGSGSWIALTGRLDSHTSGQVRDALSAHVDSHPEESVTLDLAGVEAIDATVVRVLAAIALRVERRGHRVALCNYTPALHRAVTYTGWRRLFDWT